MLNTRAGITYMLNTPVLGVDVARKSIRTTTGLISYENLVVATGARVRTRACTRICRACVPLRCVHSDGCHWW